MKRIVCLMFVLALSLFSVSAMANEELARGSKGEAVVALQKKLNNLGYSVGTADGDFGGKTESAIKLFQKEHGLTETGIADDSTLELVEKEADIIGNLTSILHVQEIDVYPIPSSGAKLANAILASSVIPGGMELFTFEQASEKLPLKLTDENCPYGWLAIKSDDEVTLAYRAKDADGISISTSSFISGAGFYLSCVLKAFDENGIEECSTYVDMEEREPHYWQPPIGMDGLGMNGYSSLNDFCEMIETV